MRKPSFWELAIATVRKNWVRLLFLFGISGLADLIKEYVRGKVMEWAVSRVGAAATWFFGDPFSFMTLTAIVALVVLAVMVAREVPTQSPILRDEQTYYPAANISKGQKRTFYIFVSLVVFLMAFGLYKYATTKALNVIFHRETFGEVRSRHVAASVILDIDIVNTGAPTTTRNWGLELHFVDGEHAMCTLVERDATAKFAHSPSDPTIVDIRELKRDELLSVTTASTPIPSGGTASGPVTFTCADYARDTVNTPGTKLILSLDDAGGTRYTYEYVVTAKLGRIVFWDEQ